jgi:hypothetical protein
MWGCVWGEGGRPVSSSKGYDALQMCWCAVFIFFILFFAIDSQLESEQLPGDRNGGVAKVVGPEQKYNGSESHHKPAHQSQSSSSDWSQRCSRQRSGEEQKQREHGRFSHRVFVISCLLRYPSLHGRPVRLLGCCTARSGESQFPRVDGTISTRSQWRGPGGCDSSHGMAQTDSKMVLCDSICRAADGQDVFRI